MTEGPQQATDNLTLPVPPPAALEVFGDRLPIAAGYAALLADTGVSHGLIGPREVPRLWDRHILNCAAIAPEFREGSLVVDVGSGAGLPGLVLAITRPDLRLQLVEPMLRRTQWLSVAVEHLGLTNVDVVRARAQEVAGQANAPYVTARAVARLETLAAWCFPLLRPGGSLVAMKGASAETELTQDTPALRALGMASGSVHVHEVAGLTDPVRTVVLTLGEGGMPSASARSHRGRNGGPTGRAQRPQGHRH